MNDTTEQNNNFELLTINEFSQRLKVGRTTIYNWKRNGTLSPGRHFIQRGKIVRYIWVLDAIREIQENSSQQHVITNKISNKSLIKKNHTNKKSIINFEY
jgi:predicted site-specific integrase-resolvase